MGDGDPFPRPENPDKLVSPTTQTPSIFPDFDIQLDFPKILTVNKMPPLPDKLSTNGAAIIIVKNNSGKDEPLYAATPCDVHHWDLLDSDGNLIESEKDGMCSFVTQHGILKAGNSIRSDYVVGLNGKLLKEISYKLRFKFWEFEAEAIFEVRFLN